jgi:hypothetical protein
LGAVERRVRWTAGKEVMLNNTGNTTTKLTARGKNFQKPGKK